MKPVIFIFAIFFLGIVFESNAQCSDELITRAKEELNGATYLCDYKVLMKKSKKKKPAHITFKVKMQKGTIYRFITANDIANESPLIAQLADDYKLLGISYDKANDKDNGGFDFLCQKTQFYYLSCYYEEGTEGCGAVLFSTVKTYTKY